MNALVKRLLLQIRCAYCGKPLSQDVERRFGKLSLCDDCFYHITGVYAKAVAKGFSKGVSKQKAKGLSNGKPKEFHIRTFSKENRGLSRRKPLLLLRNVPKGFLKSFQGD